MKRITTKEEILWTVEAIKLCGDKPPKAAKGPDSKTLLLKMLEFGLIPESVKEEWILLSL